MILKQQEHLRTETQKYKWAGPDGQETVRRISSVGKSVYSREEGFI